MKLFVSRGIVAGCLAILIERRRGQVVLAGLFSHHFMRVAAAIRTIPFAFGLSGQFNTIEMKPLYLARLVVAADHLTVRNLLAYTIRFFLLVDHIGVWRRRLMQRFIVSTRVFASIRLLIKRLLLLRRDKSFNNVF